MCSKLAKLLIGILLQSSCFAAIIETAKLQDIKTAIFKSAAQDTLVIFDVDMVLIMPNDQVFRKNVNHETKPFLQNVYAKYRKHHSEQELEEMLGVIKMPGNMQPVTNDTVDVFNEIKARGYNTMGLTACTTGSYGDIKSLEKLRVEELASLGIEFNTAWPNASTEDLKTYLSPQKFTDKRQGIPSAHSGVVFSSQIPKGEVLNAYLQYSKVLPKKVIFIDDKISNVQSIEKFCNENNIEFLGFNYHAVLEMVKNQSLDVCVAKLKFAILEQTKLWLTDAQAKEILNGIEHTN